MKHTLFMVAAAGVLGACTNKPIPDNYAKISTYDIVQKVRCESRDALKEIVIELVESVGEEPALAQELRDGKLLRTALEQDLERLTPEAQALIARYVHAGIAYTFSFDITESNNATGALGFVDVITGGTFSLGASASNNQSRQNQRTLTIKDNVTELSLDEKLDTACDGIDTGAGGIVYPIKGDLGLKEFFDTFFRLDELRILTSESTKKPTLTDTMTFTTALSGGLTPSITLSTGVSNIALGSASVGLSVVRRDVHQLSLAISLDKVEPEATADDPVAAANERSSLKALDEQRLRLFLQNSTIVTQ